MALDQAIDVDGPQRIAVPRQRPHLDQERPLPVEGQLLEGGRQLAGSQLAVLLRQGVDRRRHNVGGNAQPAREGGPGEDGGVELLDDAVEEGPRVGLGSGAVEMTAPHPAAPCAVGHEAGRGHVVREDHVGVQPELPGGDLIQGQIVLEPLLGEQALGALQGGLEGMDGGEVRAVRARDFPLGLHAEIVEDGNGRAKDLGGAAAQSSSRQVQVAPAAQPLGQGVDDVHGVRRRHRPVEIEGTHRPALSRPSSTSSARSIRLRRRPRTRSGVVR